jgi:hypothetical protein
MYNTRLNGFNTWRVSGVLIYEYDKRFIIETHPRILISF